MTAPNLTPAEALDVVRFMLSPSKEFAGRPTYCVRGVEVTKEECLAAIAKELDEHQEFSVEVHHRLQRMAPEAKGNTGELLDYVEKKLAELAQKPPAAPVPVVDIEPKTFVVVSPGAPCRFTERVIVRRFDEHKHVAPVIEQSLGAKDAWEKAWSDKPAAPVPSDKEIVDAIKRSETWGDKTSYSALRLLARRIGVQGVPQ